MSYLKKTFKKKSLWIMLYAVYLTMVLLSVQALIAQDSVDEIRANMDDKYDYFLVFNHDGKSTHYIVTRHDPNEVGKITLTYWTEYNILEIHEVSNIKKLEIDVQSMFEDESIKIFKRSFDYIPNMDLDYWFKAGDGIFTIEFDIDSSEPMEQLVFSEFPEPNSVMVNNKEWWKTGLNYSINANQILISTIPTGETTVILNFNTPNEIPIPLFSTTPENKAGINEEITFDATASFDIDGEIKTWLWDFGDMAGKDSGVTVKYQYSEPGTYTIRLTVRDNSEPYAEAFIEKNITVEYGAEENNDNDGLPDNWEWQYFKSLNFDEDDDPDLDGYSNGLEYIAGTNPNDNSDFKQDSDTDGLDDDWEWKYFQALSQGPQGDPDNDKATNLEEFQADTDPTSGTSKPVVPSDDDEDESQGIFGMGADMDLIIILLIIVIIVLVALSIIISRRKKRKPEAPSMEAPEQVPQVQTPQERTPLQQPPTQTPTQTQVIPPPTQSLTSEPPTQIESFAQKPQDTPSSITQVSGPQTQPPSMTQPGQVQAQTQEVPGTVTTTGLAPTTHSQPAQTAPLPVKGPPMSAEESNEQTNIEYEPEPIEPQNQEPPVDLMESTPENEQIAEPELGFDVATPIPEDIEEPPMEQPDEMVPEPVTEEMEELKNKMVFQKVKVPSPPEGMMAIKTTEPTRDEIINEYISNFGIDLITASNIYDAGYIKIEYLKLAAVDELAAIDGVGYETATYIKGKANLLAPRQKGEGSGSNGQLNNHDQPSIEDKIPGEELLDD
jgi:PKD repeat protein